MTEELVLADEAVLNTAAEVREILRLWENAPRKAPLPAEAIDAVEELIITLGDPEFSWDAGRSSLLGAATGLCRMCERTLDDHGYLVNISTPDTWLDCVRRLVEAVYTVENPPRQPGATIKPLPSMAEHSKGNSRPMFIARCYGWTTSDGQPDEERARNALWAFRRGESVRHPSTVTFRPRELPAVSRHPGHVQAFAQRLLQRREEAEPSSLKEFGDEIDESPAGLDVTPEPFSYPAGPRGRPAA